MPLNKEKELDKLMGVLTQFEHKTLSASESMKMMLELQSQFQDIYNLGLKDGFELKKEADKRINKN